MILGGAHGYVMLPASGGGTPPGSDSFNVLRDWSGKFDQSNWSPESDMSWSGASAKVAVIENPGGPWADSKNLLFTSGVDYLVATASILGQSGTAPYISVGFWIYLTGFSTPGVTQRVAVVTIYNLDNNNFLDVCLVLKTNGSIYLEGSHGTAGSTRYSHEHATAMTTGAWVFCAVEFDHTTSTVNTVWVEHGTAGRTGSRPLAGGIGANTYDEVRIGRFTDIASNVKNLKLSQVFVQRRLFPGGETAALRAITTFASLESRMRSNTQPIKWWPCHDKDLTPAINGDGFFHDISWQCNSAFATNGTLTRNISGPLDSGGSYRFRDGTTAVAHYAVPISAVDQTVTLFYRYEGTESNFNDWFVRLDGSAGSYIQLEARNGGAYGKLLRLRYQPAGGSPFIADMELTPLFDGSWHRIAMTVGDLGSEWNVAVDGILHLPSQPPDIYLLSSSTTISWGNIDCNLAMLAYKDARDADVYTTWYSLANTAAVIDYHESRSYKGLWKMRVTATG